MNILITYDVQTSDPEGPRRLRRVARACQDYGRRVQNSVFELEISEALLVMLTARLGSIIDKTTDTIRIYNLGPRPRITTLGRATTYDIDAPLII